MERDGEPFRSGRHCPDRQEVDSERAHNPSSQSRAFFAIFFCLLCQSCALEKWVRPDFQLYY